MTEKKTKVCKICKDKKEIKYFTKYGMNTKNEPRYRGYCKKCEYKKKKDRDISIGGIKPDVIPVEEKTRTCIICKEEKDMSGYKTNYISKKGITGYLKYCKACQSKKQHEYYINNKEKFYKPTGKPKGRKKKYVITSYTLEEVLQSEDLQKKFKKRIDKIIAMRFKCKINKPENQEKKNDEQ